MKNLYLNGILFVCCLSSVNLESSERSTGPGRRMPAYSENIDTRTYPAFDFNIPNSELTPGQQADRAAYVDKYFRDNRLEYTKEEMPSTSTIGQKASARRN